MKTLSKVTIMSLCLAAFVVACDSASENPLSVPDGPTIANAVLVNDAGDRIGTYEQLEICKDWVGGSVIATTFDVTTNNDTGANGGTSQPTLNDASADDSQCRNVVLFDGLPGDGSPGNAGNTDFLSVVEQQPPGTQLVSIRAISVDKPGATINDLTVNAGTPNASMGAMTLDFAAGSWSANLGDNTIGYLVTFTNELIPIIGGEGCTPGYWKQDQHFDSWASVAGIGPSELFTAAGFNSPGSDARFKRGRSEHDVATQLDALQANQGSLAALTRHAMAALLNALSPNVDYDLTPGEVTAKYNAAIAGGDVEGTKNEFAGFNELGCPIN